MLSTTKAIPNLVVIPDTTNVIEDIIRQSLETAVLIGEYTKLDFGSNSVPHLHDPAESNDALFIVRTVKIQTAGAILTFLACFDLIFGAVGWGQPLMNLLRWVN